MRTNGTKPSSGTRSAEMRSLVALSIRLALVGLVGLAGPAALLAATGDPARGRAVALDPERGDCAICHRLPEGDARDQGTIGPPLLDLADRYDAPALKARIANPKATNPDTAMPAYGVTGGLHRVPAALTGRPILTDAELDDLVAWLLVEPR